MKHTFIKVYIIVSKLILSCHIKLIEFLFCLDDIVALLSEAKKAASDVNGTASDALARIHNISEELNKTRIPTQASNLNNILDDVNKTRTTPQLNPKKIQ